MKTAGINIEIDRMSPDPKPGVKATAKRHGFGLKEGSPTKFRK